MESDELAIKSHTILKACTSLFFGLGDEERQKILIDISVAGKNGINVSELAKKSRLSRPAVSHHLKVLKACNLVSSRKNGTQVFYSLNISEPLMKFSEFIKEVENLIAQVKERENSEEENKAAGK